MHTGKSGRRFLLAVGTFIVTLGMLGAQIMPVQASVSVGARNFTEEQIAGYLYGDLLAHHGYKVSTNVGFAQESNIFAALEGGSVNIDPDYLGNGYEDDGVPNDSYKPGTSIKRVVTHINKYFKKMSNPLEVLTPSPKFNDQNVFVTTARLSKKYGLKTLSDLARLAPKLSFEVLHECTTRADCLLGFNSVYHPKKFKKYADPVNGTSTSMPPFYGDLIKGTYDVVQGYGVVNDQAIFSKYHLVPLKDNKHMLPPDQLAPFVSVKLIKQHPSIKTWLNKLSKIITNKNFAKMDAQGATQPPQEVADKFLKAQHLIK